MEIPIVHSKSHVWHLFVVRCKDRGRLQQFLSDNAIQTLIHYPIPPHLQKAYAYFGYRRKNFPITEEIADTCLSLPIWPGLTYENVKEVSRKVYKYNSDK